MDRVWWDKYIREVRKIFNGECYTAVNGCYDVRYSSAHHYQNSGAGAISLAARMGIKKIIMLGYDCGHTGGKTHWHGDHPAGLANAGAVKDWPAEFKALAEHLALNGVQVINCSRATRLTCFERADLAAVLQIKRAYCYVDHSAARSKRLFVGIPQRQ